MAAAQLRTRRPPACRNVLLFEPHEWPGRGRVALPGTDSRARHVRGVLGSAPGDGLRVGVVGGPLGRASVLHPSGGPPSDEPLRLRWEADLEQQEAPPRVDLLLAMPRPKAFKRLVAPLVALGLGRLYVAKAQRVEKSYLAKASALGEDSLYAEVLRGLEQSERSRVPGVYKAWKLRALVAALAAGADPVDDPEAGCVEILAPRPGPGPSGPSGYRALVVAHPGAAATVPEAAAAAAGGGRVLLAVGPEGGWQEEEMAILANAGFRAAALGDRPLTTETACVALLSLVKHSLGDW